MALALFLSSQFFYAQEKEFIIDQIYNPTVGASKNVAVVYLGGSEGGLPNFNFERDELPKLGYPTLGVGYFGTDNTPATLELIPLEYIIQAITSFANKPEIKGK